MCHIGFKYSIEELRLRDDWNRSNLRKTRYLLSNISREETYFFEKSMEELYKALDRLAIDSFEFLAREERIILQTMERLGL